MLPRSLGLVLMASVKVEKQARDTLTIDFDAVPYY
jgi:hypothetical protein